MTTTVQTPTLAAPQMTPPEVATALNAIVGELSVVFKERRAAITAMTLATLSKQHVFILGSPGTGKSAMTRAFFERFTDAVYFEAILSKTRPPEAILGPWDIPELRDHGHMFRKYNGFLPTANFALLDEIGKMAPTLGHDLLAVVNERRLHQVNGGRSWIDVPLYTFIGGSNELPTAESDDAAAMWDRMLVRVVVDYVKETGNWVDMLAKTKVTQHRTEIDFPSLAHVIDTVVPQITLPADVMQTVVRLREDLTAQSIIPSDRRWVQSMDLLRASAFLAGRTSAIPDDVEVLRYALWDTPSQIKPVENATLAVANPLGSVILQWTEAADSVAQEARAAAGLSTDNKTQTAVALLGRLRTLDGEIASKKQEALQAGSSTLKIDEVADLVAGIKSSIQTEMLNF